METEEKIESFPLDSVMEGVKENQEVQVSNELPTQVQEKKITFLGKQVKGISGSTIKIIAILSMLIDHTAAVLVQPMWMKAYMTQMQNNTLNAYGYYPVFDSFTYKLYDIMRSIGRLGFPIFCFLLVEGFIHTRSKVKYVVRLGLFALISEVAFDLAFNHEVFETGYQNVFFTLFLGMVVLVIVDKIMNLNTLKLPLRFVLSVPVIVAGMFAAQFLNTDYAALGVITIVIMYFLRNHKTAEMYGGCMALTLGTLGEAYAFLAMIPIALYNGKRGLKLKYFFYLFYPGHLLLLVGLAKLFGLN